MTCRLLWQVSFLAIVPPRNGTIRHHRKRRSHHSPHLESQLLGRYVDGGGDDGVGVWEWRRMRADDDIPLELVSESIGVVDLVVGPVVVAVVAVALVRRDDDDCGDGGETAFVARKKIYGDGRDDDVGVTF